MSEIKHTPGPWTLETVRTSVGICHKVGEFPSSSPSRPGTYACVYGDHINADDAYRGHPLAVELLANARLIAAAPDLLAALKETTAAAEIACRMLKRAGFSDELIRAGHAAGIADNFGERARAAIAKAENVK